MKDLFKGGGEASQNIITILPLLQRRIAGKGKITRYYPKECYAEKIIRLIRMPAEVEEKMLFL